MSKPIEGESAFPSDRFGMSGISERRYYIGKALQGFCANPDLMHHVSEGIARLAIEHADAVMSMLYPQSEKEPNQ